MRNLIPFVSGVASGVLIMYTITSLSTHDYSGYLVCFAAGVITCIGLIKYGKR